MRDTHIQNLIVFTKFPARNLLLYKLKIKRKKYCIRLCIVEEFYLLFIKSGSQLANTKFYQIWYSPAFIHRLDYLQL